MIILQYYRRLWIHGSGFIFHIDEPRFWFKYSASSWEPLRRAIKNLIPIFFVRDNLIIKHKKYIDMLKWQDEANLPDPVPAKSCNINCGVLDELGNLITRHSTNSQNLC
jgi:hypothetical protein